MLRHVTSAGGVRIACETSGEGPPVVLVHGAGSARWSFDLLRPHLERGFTVIAIDRRGRGDSGDGDGYQPEREFEDVAAVVQDAGDGAALVGHSYGGLVAVGAAQRLVGLERLVLYEPPMGGVLATAETIERWELLVESGESDLMVREFLRDIGGYGEAEIDALAATPMWDARRRVAPSVPRELRAELAHRLDPEALAGVDAQALLVVGSESPAWAVRSTDAYADALPRAETRVLEGHGHGANVTAPELVAAEIERFLAG